MENLQADSPPFICTFFAAKIKGEGVRITGFTKKCELPEDEDIHFFPEHNQVLEKHAPEVVSAVRSAQVQYHKRVDVNITSCITKYYNLMTGELEFNGVKLKSQSKERAKVARLKLNRELAAIKGVQTRKRNKERVAVAKHQRRLQEEEEFQAKRFDEVRKLKNRLKTATEPETTTRVYSARLVNVRSVATSTDEGLENVMEG